MLYKKPQPYFNPTLSIFIDGQPHVSEEVNDYVAEKFHTSKKEREEYEGACPQPIFQNNVAWALGGFNGRYGTFFIVQDEKTKAYQITEKGRALRQKFPKEIAIKDLKEFKI